MNPGFFPFFLAIDLRKKTGEFLFSSALLCLCIRLVLFAVIGKLEGLLIFKEKWKDSLLSWPTALAELGRNSRPPLLENPDLSDVQLFKPAVGLARNIEPTYCLDVA